MSPTLRPLLFLAVVAGALSAASSSRAQKQPPPSQPLPPLPSSQPVPPPPRPYPYAVAPAPAPYDYAKAPAPWRVHDGFYARMALGLGAMRVSQAAELSSGSGYDSSMGAAGGAGEVSLGGTPARGLVVAGTFLMYVLPNPTVSSPAGSSGTDQQVDFGVLGVSVDWFPNPRDGFHLGGTLGAGWKSGYDRNGYAVHASSRAGGALAISTGYDWWIGREWSIGFLARVVGADLRGDETVGGSSRTLNDRGVAGSMLLSMLYH